jgi:hypothetical protein
LDLKIQEKNPILDLGLGFRFGFHGFLDIFWVLGVSHPNPNPIQKLTRNCALFISLRAITR